MDNYCQEHKDIRKKLEDIYILTNNIYVFLRGDLQKKGWISRLETIEKHDKFLTRACIYIFSAIGTGLITFVWALLTNSITIIFNK